ncbi:MAG: hypothetical protein ABFS18_09060 [Thermodesulfobacteriota bacterium]
MKTKLLTISLLTFIAGIGMAGDSHALFTDEYQFDDPVNMGPNINTAHYEGQQTLTADGNSMFFVSTRPGGYGGYDLYNAERVNGVWQPAENMGSVVNSDRYDNSPAVSPDGNRLFFTSARGMPGNNYSRIWLTERIDGVWQAPVLLPTTVNFSWANNNAQFVSHDGKWLYMSCWGGYGWWDIYRIDLTTGDFSIREQLSMPINTYKRDFALYQTMDEKYFVVYTDNGGWQVKAWEKVDGVYQNAENLPAPFYYKFSMAENESLLYIQGDFDGGYGGQDIYSSLQVANCSSFGIASVAGAEQLINPLPLAGQTIALDVAVTGSSAPQDISWTLFANNQVVSEGSSLADGVTWDGRNGEGGVEPGTYNLVLSVVTNKGACMAEQSLTAVLGLTDECKLRVTFP